MHGFKQVEPKALADNPFALIGERWALLTAGEKEACNTMTVSWGHFGIMWHLPTLWCHVRPSRHTFQFMEVAPLFTLSFLPEGNRKALEYCGSHSGRDGDKIAAAGLTVFEPVPGAPSFEEAGIIAVCRKLYAHDLDPAAFLDERIAAHYVDGDYHKMYLAEVSHLFIKE